MEDSPTQSHVLQLAHPPIPIVRIGIIGPADIPGWYYSFMHIA